MGAHHLLSLSKMLVQTAIMLKLADFIKMHSTRAGILGTIKLAWLCELMINQAERQDTAYLLVLHAQQAHKKVDIQ